MAGGIPPREIRSIERVFFDTNVVLDVPLHRQPWVVQGSALWKAVAEGHIAGYIAATTLTNIFSLARRAKGLEGAFEAVAVCLDTFEVCGTRVTC